jgi:hypothetical protein
MKQVDDNLRTIQIDISKIKTDISIIKLNQKYEHEFVLERISYLKMISGKFVKNYCRATATFF